MTFQFNIQIKDIKDPPIWRRLLVPARFSFWKLHELIQVSFGWKDAHLFEFSPAGYGTQPMIGIPYEESEETIVDAKEITLSEIFTSKGQQFTYLYDFGDSWEHLITLENIADFKMVKAAFLEGDGAGPPEDCGGVHGYAALKSVMKNSSHPEYAEYKVWLGLARNKKFDAHVFNAEKVSMQVARI